MKTIDLKVVLSIVGCISLFSCNHIPEAILAANTERVDTLDVTEYTFVIDKKNRRGYVTTDREVMDGTYVITREGEVIEQLNITGGFLNGELIRYYENGQPEAIETYKTSVQHGPTTSFYRNGAIRSESSFDNGVENPESVSYHEDGSVSHRVVVTDGVRYEHEYRNGNRISSMFEKEIDGKTFQIMMMYDDFGTVQLIMGTRGNGEIPEVYIFDSEFNEVEHFNMQDDPLRAQEFLAFMQQYF